MKGKFSFAILPGEGCPLFSCQRSIVAESSPNAYSSDGAGYGVGCDTRQWSMDLKVRRTCRIAFCCLIAAVASLFYQPSSSAQEPTASFPTRPVQVVVPFAAGGSSDVVVRMLAQTVSK